MFNMEAMPLVYSDSPLHCPALHPGDANVRWKPPSGMPVFTCLSNYVTSALFAVPALDGIDLATLPLGAWPACHFNSLKDADVARLLDAEAKGSGVRVGASTIPGGGRGVFATRKVKKGTRLMPFTGQILYQCLDAEASALDPQLKNSRYGTSKFTTSARNWEKTAVGVKIRGGAWLAAARTGCTLKSSRSNASKKCRKRCLCTRSVWIVPAPFCVAGVVNDYRRVRGPVGSSPSLSSERKPNAMLVQRCDPAL